MAGFLSDNFIQRVLDETDIVSLIDSFVPLQRKVKIIGLFVLSVKMAIILPSVSARKNNFIIVLDAELQATQ